MQEKFNSLFLIYSPSVCTVWAIASFSAAAEASVSGRHAARNMAAASRMPSPMTRYRLRSRNTFVWSAPLVF